jgi:manganese/zinc/iron transport system permease protein
VTIVCVLLFWKEFKLLSFDPDFAGSLGYNNRLLDVLLTTLTVIAIVVGLQTVGVVLMSAMLVAPAAAARQWTQRLDRMVLLAGFFGAMAGLLGAVTSSQVAKLPTGPTIVLYMSGIVLLSLLLAPERGIVSRMRQRRRQRVQFAAEALLVHLLNHEGQPDESIESALTHMREHMRWSEGFASSVARWAVTNKFVLRRNGRLALTPYGRETARHVMLR